jgi:hypothetical protein
VLGIEGYDPQWYHNARPLAAAHRVRFGRLIGRPLAGAWLMWDVHRDCWLTDGPVILGFGDSNVELTHRKFDECAITWNQVDMSIPLDWAGMHLDWLAEPHPALGAAYGRRLLEVNVIERIMPSYWRPRVLHAVEFRFEGARLSIYNAMDENGISGAAEIDLPIGFWRRVPIA